MFAISFDISLMNLIRTDKIVTQVTLGMRNIHIGQTIIFHGQKSLEYLLKHYLTLLTVLLNHHCTQQQKDLVVTDF